MSRVFVTREFDKWARKERIRDTSLLDAAEGADAGLIDANLKGCLVKLRVARSSAGKRDGYRTILAYRVRDRAFFLYGFAKNDRRNVDNDEVEALDDFGRLLLELVDAEITVHINEGKIREMQR